MRFKFTDGQVQPTQTYGNFVNVLEQLMTQNRRASVITFNYDLGLDYALQFHRHGLDYCLEPSQFSPSLRLLKLHGSLNWARCTECGKIVVVANLSRNKIGVGGDVELNLERHINALQSAAAKVLIQILYSSLRRGTRRSITSILRMFGSRRPLS